MPRLDRMLILFFVAMLMLSAPAICQTTGADATTKTAANVEKPNPKFIFLFIGDGMGPAHRRLGEFVDNPIGNKKLLMNDLPVKCLTATHSANAKVTDSAAAGTAIACGVKTNNGMLGQTPDGKEVMSVAEKAKAAGMRVGILTSVTLNHATPAAFFANVKSRNMYDDISGQLAKSNFDFFAAGGFAKKKQTSEDIVTLWKKAGYKVMVSPTAPNEKIQSNLILLNSQKSKPLLYWVNALNKPIEELSLPVLVSTAIRQLDNPKGFFMMVEGGQIDWAGHGNLAAAIAYDVVDLNKSVEVAYDFYKKYPNDTLIVVTADHETGGMALDESKIDMKRLVAIHHAYPALKEKVAALKKEKADLAALEKIGESELKTKLTNEEKAELGKLWAKTLKDAKKEYVSGYLKNLAQARVGVSFSTGGHTAAKVPTTAVGCGADLFKNAKDNTDIAKFIMQMIPAKK